MGSSQTLFSLESLSRLYTPPSLVMVEPIPFTLAPLHRGKACRGVDVAPFHLLIHNHYDDLMNRTLQEAYDRIYTIDKDANFL